MGRGKHTINLHCYPDQNSKYVLFHVWSHLSLFSQDSSVLCIIIVCSVLLLDNFPLYELPQFIYPLGLFPAFGCYKYSCYERACVCLLVYTCVFLLGINLGMELLAPGIYICSISVNIVSFPKCVYHVSFPPTFYERSSCFIFLPALGIICLFCFSHSDVNVVICHCNFNFQFPNNS